MSPLIRTGLPRLLCALGALSLAFGLTALEPAHAQSEPAPAKTADNPLAELRAMFLRNSAEELHLSPEQAAAPVRGVVMDIGFAEGVTITVLGFPTGDASIYVSTGGGFIGGGNHETIARAAKAWVAEAELGLSALQPVQDYPLPATGEVRLYVMTPQGLLGAQARQMDLAQQLHPLWPLFYHGQDIITQYRLVQQKQKQAQR